MTNTEKFDAMGFNHYKWFESYLKGRKQMVVVNDVGNAMLKEYNW